MSDQNNQDQQPVFNIQRIYLKDMSLEQPNSPSIFLEQEGPGIEVQIDVGNEKLADGIYEATVTVTVTAKIKDKIATFRTIRSSLCSASLARTSFIPTCARISLTPSRVPASRRFT